MEMFAIIIITITIFIIVVAVIVVCLPVKYDIIETKSVSLSNAEK
jgi:hypothetical protein